MTGHQLGSFETRVIQGMVLAGGELGSHRSMSVLDKYIPCLHIQYLCNTARRFDRMA